jgi:hypothetical protein
LRLAQVVGGWHEVSDLTQRAQHDLYACVNEELDNNYEFLNHCQIFQSLGQFGNITIEPLNLDIHAPTRLPSAASPLFGRLDAMSFKDDDC